MHSTLVDWLVEEYGSYGVQTTAFCLCVHIMDEYLRRVADVPTYRFQLLGCVCLLIASKLEQTTVRKYYNSRTISESSKNLPSLHLCSVLILTIW